MVMETLKKVSPGRNNVVNRRVDIQYIYIYNIEFYINPHIYISMNKKHVYGYSLAYSMYMVYSMPNYLHLGSLVW